MIFMIKIKHTCSPHIQKLESFDFEFMHIFDV